MCWIIRDIFAKKCPKKKGQRNLYKASNGISLSLHLKSFNARNKNAD